MKQYRWLWMVTSAAALLLVSSAYTWAVGITFVIAAITGLIAGMVIKAFGRRNEVYDNTEEFIVE